VEAIFALLVNSRTVFAREMINFKILRILLINKTLINRDLEVYLRCEMIIYKESTKSITSPIKND
jgi:hypothetical protein